MPKLTEVADDAPVLQQILAAGLYPFLQDCDISDDGASVDGIASALILDNLDNNAYFLRGPLSALHPEIGTPRRDYRSLQGKYGPGSLQCVINPVTLKVHLDIDRYNPYHDLVRWVGHTGEVLKGWWPFRRRQGDRA